MAVDLVDIPDGTQHLPTSQGWRPASGAVS
jgi:hypothetical protein